MKSKPLKDIKILIAESDPHLGRVLFQVLERMGFKDIKLVRDGEAALASLQQQPRDILLTEWQIHAVDGINLTREIRRSQQALNRLLPIIMMTARAERQDVEVARDAGITEFVVKPYNTHTLFKRIQQVIDNPRGFLLAEQYVGPDRRRRVLPLSHDERRMFVPEVVLEAPSEPILESPMLVLPDYYLKKKLGDVDALDKIITPDVLADAQTVIDNLKDESLQWIGKDVARLNVLYKQMQAGASDDVLAEILELLLSIKSNAGTFGYVNASHIAQQLYHFLRFGFNMGSSPHNHVLLKHIQSITVLLSSNAEGRSLEKEHWLMHALKLMIAKFQHDK